MVDFATVVAKPRVIEIKHPDGTDRLAGIRVTILSLDDPKLQAVKRKIQNERNRLAAKGKYFKAEETDENKFEVLFGAMSGWEWYNPTGEKGKDNPDYDPDGQATFESEIPEFNRRMVKKVFTTMPWFENQINEAVDDEAAFFG